jgi:hypothetical protein
VAPPTPQYSQQTLNALLAQPNILSILSMLPQPPPPDPNAAPVHTRSGRPSRPPQQPDENLAQIQAAAWAGLDPSFLEALAHGAAAGTTANPTAIGASTPGSGLDAMLSGAVDANGAQAFEPTHLDWWWPIQEEGEDEDPSYFPPSTNTPTGHLETPTYVFTPSAYVDETAIFRDSAPANAVASGSGYLNGYMNGQHSHGNGLVSETESRSTVGGGKRPAKRSRKGKEKATDEAGSSSAAGKKRRVAASTNGGSVDGTPQPYVDRSNLSREEKARLRREDNKRTGQCSSPYCYPSMTQHHRRLNPHFLAGLLQRSSRE